MNGHITHSCFAQLTWGFKLILHKTSAFPELFLEVAVSPRMVFFQLLLLLSVTCAWILIHGMLECQWQWPHLWAWARKTPGHVLYEIFHFHQVKAGSCAEQLGSLMVRMSPSAWVPCLQFSPHHELTNAQQKTWGPSTPHSSLVLCPANPCCHAPLNTQLCPFSSETC